MAMTFTVGGRVVDASYLAMLGETQKKAKPKAASPEEFHKGWQAEGFPPGHIAEAKAEADKAVAAWEAMTPEKIDAATKQGRRPPASWDEEKFLATHKRKKVRSKPYEVEAAARECAALAERSGWTHVRVVSVQKSRHALIAPALL